MLDKTSMFGVTSTKRDGEQKRHHVSSGRPCCTSEKEHRTPRSSAHTRRQAASLLLALVVFFKRDVFSKFTHKFYYTTVLYFYLFFPGVVRPMLSGCCRPCSMYACRDGFFFIAYLRRVLSCGVTCVMLARMPRQEPKKEGDFVVPSAWQARAAGFRIYVAAFCCLPHVPLPCSLFRSVPFLLSVPVLDARVSARG